MIYIDAPLQEEEDEYREVREELAAELRRLGINPDEECKPFGLPLTQEQAVEIFLRPAESE